MSDAKTGMTDEDIGEFLARVTPERRQQDAHVLDQLFRRATGWQPRIWGPSIIGYGSYAYRYTSGREGVFLATGFAPRRAKMVVYIMPGYSDFSAILDRLGPHKRGKACLYLGALSKVDLTVLEQLVRAGLYDLQSRWPVSAT